MRGKHNKNMSLQNLLVKQAEVEEDVVERVVAQYVKYSDVGKILLGDHFGKLANTKKVAVYLVAKQGWKFIPGKEELAKGADNAELERELKLPGNTLRPVVKNLRDRGFVTSINAVHYPTEQLILHLAAGVEI